MSIASSPTSKTRAWRGSKRSPPIPTTPGCTTSWARPIGISPSRGGNRARREDLDQALTQFKSALLLYGSGNYKEQVLTHERLGKLNAVLRTDFGEARRHLGDRRGGLPVTDRRLATAGIRVPAGAELLRVRVLLRPRGEGNGPPRRRGHTTGRRSRATASTRKGGHWRCSGHGVTSAWRSASPSAKATSRRREIISPSRRRRSATSAWTTDTESLHSLADDGTGPGRGR